MHTLITRQYRTQDDALSAIGALKRNGFTDGDIKQSGASVTVEAPFGYAVMAMSIMDRFEPVEANAAYSNPDVSGSDLTFGGLIPSLWRGRPRTVLLKHDTSLSRWLGMPELTRSGKPLLGGELLEGGRPIMGGLLPGGKPFLSFLGIPELIRGR
jgi:hypothetical protein